MKDGSDKRARRLLLQIYSYSVCAAERASTRLAQKEVIPSAAAIRSLLYRREEVAWRRSFGSRSASATILRRLQPPPSLQQQSRRQQKEERREKWQRRCEQSRHRERERGVNKSHDEQSTLHSARSSSGEWREGRRGEWSAQWGKRANSSTAAVAAEGGCTQSPHPTASTRRSRLPRGWQ